MPRKKNPQFTKPTTVAHPSLSPSNNKNAAQRLNATSDRDTKSVNDLIQHLRRSQISTSPPERPHRDNPQTVHPSLNAILDVPITPAPRPRPGLRVVGGRRSRGPSGPPAPISWVSSDRASSNPSIKYRTTHGRLLNDHGGLPGLRLPNEGSLLHLALKQLAQEWASQKECEQHYLATLPIRHKEALLSYIAHYNPQEMDLRGIEILCLDDPELEGATGCESLSNLDVSSCLGRGLRPQDLKNILFKQPKAPVQASMAGVEQGIPESWDSPSLQKSMPLRNSILSSRFISLTHLSLSNPNGSYWKHLLGVAPHIATLTHLSLAYWPTPCLTPNSATAYRDTPAGKVNYGGSNFYSAYDGDVSDAASVLRRLSKATYCLQWLDLTGCVDWLQASIHEEGPDWTGAWRGVEAVQMGQGWLPQCLEEQSSAWRQVVEASALDDSETLALPALEAQKKELLVWAATEWDIVMAQNTVNKMRLYTRGDRPNEGSSSSKAPHRYGRIEFHRGWEGFWIEDALQHIWNISSKSRTVTYA